MTTSPALLLALSACGGSETPPAEQEEFAQGGRRLSAPLDVLGFEDPADWTAQSGSIEATETHTQGQRALAWSPQGRSSIESVQLGSLSGIGSEISLDIRVPGPVDSGEVRLIMQLPSQRFPVADLGGQFLPNLKVGEFDQIRFTLGSDIQAALSAEYSDLSFKVILDAPEQAEPYIIDNLVVATAGEPGGEPGEGEPGEGEPLPEVEIEANPEPFTFKLPGKLQPQDVAVLATSSLRLGEGCQIRRGPGFGDVVNLGTQGETHVEDGAQVGDTYSGCPVRVGSGALAGDITAKGGADVAGDAACGEVADVASLPGLTDYPWSPSAPPAAAGEGEDINAAGEELPPGVYGDIRVGGGTTLILTAGVYTCTGLFVEPGGTLVVDDSAGPVEVYIDDLLSWGGTVTNRGGEPNPDVDVLIVVRGDQDVLLDTPISGTVSAPDAIVRLASPGEPGYSGSFFGGGVDIGPGVIVRHRPFPWSSRLPVVPTTWGDSQVNVSASVDNISGESTPGEVTTDSPVRFTVPDFLPVRSGNAGNGTAVFRYRSPNGTTVSCSYVGGAGIEHPDTPFDRMAGLRYEFAGCDDGTQAGEDRTADHFSVEVLNGDAQHPAATTEVVFDSGDGCSGSLPPALQPTEVASLREDFHWGEYNPLAETDPEGHPALWYGLIYVERQEQLQALDRLRVLWSAKPLNRNYSEQLRGRCGRVEHSADERGVVVYAVFPAKFFNLMRQFGVEAEAAGIEAPFRFIIPSAPGEPEYLNTDGSLKYSALSSTGYLQWLQERAATQPGLFSKIKKGLSKVAKGAVGWVDRNIIDPIVGAGEATFSFVGSSFDAVIDFTANALDDVWELAQQGLQELVLVFEKNVQLRLRLRMLNRDPLFPQASYMVRAWGPGCDATDRSMRFCGGAGANDDGTVGDRPLIVPTSAKLRVRQWGFGFLPVMDEGTIDRYGEATLEAVKGTGGRGGDLCVQLDADYGMITTDFIPNEVCDFAVNRYGNFEHNIDASQDASQPDESRKGTLNISQRDLHSFTQMRDGFEYNRQVLGFEPSRMDVLTGWAANGMTSMIAGGHRAMCLCLDFPSTGQAAITAITGGATAGAAALTGPVGGLAASALMFAASYVEKDLWWPESDSEDSRGVMTHEYGHFTMCDLLYQTGGSNALTGLIARLADGEDSREDETGIMTESIADVYAMQVVGGVNYIEPDNSVDARAGASNGKMSYCVTSDCLDANYRGAGDYLSLDFYDEIARTESLIYDAFDRSDATQRLQTAVSNSDYWVLEPAGLVFSALPYLQADDEPVSLAGAGWGQWVASWLQRGTVPNRGNVLGGLFDTLESNGVNWCDRCELAAAHDPTLALTSVLVPSSTTRSTAVRLDRFRHCAGDAGLLSLIGPAPEPSGALSLSCEVCSDGSFLDPATGTCQACGVGQVGDPVNLRCVDCSADAVVDFSASTSACSFATSSPVSAAADNCPNETWLEVQLPVAATLASVDFLEFEAIPTTGSAAECTESSFGLEAYSVDAAGALVLQDSVSIGGTFLEGSGDFVESQCTAPGALRLPSAALTAGGRLRVRADFKRGAAAVGGSVTSLLAQETSPDDCVVIR